MVANKYGWSRVTKVIQHDIIRKLTWIAFQRYITCLYRVNIGMSYTIGKLLNWAIPLTLFHPVHYLLEGSNLLYCPVAIISRYTVCSLCMCSMKSIQLPTHVPMETFHETLKQFSIRFHYVQSPFLMLDEPRFQHGDTFFSLMQTHSPLLPCLQDVIS